MMNKLALILNAGSATLKFKLFNIKNQKEIARGNVERINLPGSFLTFNGKKWPLGKLNSHRQALRNLLGKIGQRRQEIKLIGHRVVHGGEKFIQPTVVNKKIWREIDKYSELAPLHNPISLAVIKACFSLIPRAVNIAVFDTAFFSSLKEEEYLYALPLDLYKRYRIRRYGFHGISHRYAAQTAAQRLGKPPPKLNLITVHLGNGCSIAAIQEGRPILVSMGFTPLEGLVMGTRSGDLDPAIPLFLQKRAKMTWREVDILLNKKSGLLGLSGFSSDMREILKAAGQKVNNYQGRKQFSREQKKRARLAFKVFISRLRHYIILCVGLLGRIDAVIFTGGIGERSSVIRKLAWQGLKFNKAPKILVVPANEELAIFQQIRNKV